MSVSENLAIAFDLGTTTIAAALLDRETGRYLASVGALNPQREFGPDVVSRLDAALNSAGALPKMKELVNDELRRLARELLEGAGLSGDSVKIAAIAGNPAMEHLFLGLPVDSLAFPPYRPLFTTGRIISCGHLPVQS